MIVHQILNTERLKTVRTTVVSKHPAPGIQILERARNFLFSSPALFYLKAGTGKFSIFMKTFKLKRFIFSVPLHSDLIKT